MDDGIEWSYFKLPFNRICAALKTSQRYDRPSPRLQLAAEYACWYSDPRWMVHQCTLHENHTPLPDWQFLHLTCYAGKRTTGPDGPICSRVAACSLSILAFAFLARCRSIARGFRCALQFQ